MTRALFVCANMDQGGAERHWSLLLPGLRERGFDVRLLTLDGRGAFYDTVEAAGISADCAEQRHPGDLRGLRRALRFAGHPDLVVSRPVSGTLVGELIAARAHAPHVVNEHRQVGKAHSGRREALMRLVAKRVDGVIGIVDDQRADLAARGFRARDIVIVPNGVATVPDVPARRAAVRDRLGVAPDAFVAVLVATLRPEKRVDVFIDALRTTGGLVQGLVVGDGPCRASLEAQAAGAPVTFVGPTAAVDDYMVAADAVCLSSDFEGVPMVILEAMALGRPVVTTEVGGVGEAVIDGETGMLVAPRDHRAFGRALVALAADGDYAARLGAAGRVRHAGRFSAQAMVDGYATALRGFLTA